MRAMLAVVALAAGLNAWGAGPEAHPAAPSPAAADTEAIRQAAQADKRGLVERNMQLTPEEAKRFWPIYEDYQRRLEPIARRQNRAIQDYLAAESSMTDANAKRIAREVLAADADEQKLRERELRKLLSALPARKAVRYLQIENKLRAINRYELARQIPLVR
ncbi:MAG TPA: hypothetical protein VEG27_07135 [Usitatibacter sp.]|nr:hypothetical protein [Usitatibacter sp.]